VLVKFAVKSEGASHTEKGLPCQDAARACVGNNATIGIACVADGHGSTEERIQVVVPQAQFGIACVADGHGGSKYFRSAKGSELAIQIAEKALMGLWGTMAALFMQRSRSEDEKNNVVCEKLKELEANIIYNWRKAVEQDMGDNPFTQKEIEHCKKNNIALGNDPQKLMFVYGTTLLAGLVSDSFWFAIQIGDGLCVVLEDEENITTPIAEDERLAFGATTSLCDSDALGNFREDYGFTRIKGLTVATDGVTDSFMPEKYLEFNKGLCDRFTGASADASEEERKLQEFLPGLSERGSRDDVSMAGIFRMRER